MLATLAVPEDKECDSQIFSLGVATAVFLLPGAWDYDLSLVLIPLCQLAVVATHGEVSLRAILIPILSYILLIGSEYVALSSNGCGFFSMLAAHLSAYWLAADQHAAAGVPLLSMPSEISRRLVPAG
jgi:hypothetical protein